MYQQFFGLTDEPFKKDIKTSDLFHSSSLKELFKRFEYIKEHRGIMVVSGESGTGKTTALRYLLDSLNPKAFLPLYIALSTVRSSDFYRQLNSYLKGERSHYKSQVYQAIQQQIMDYAVHKSIIPFIVFDEAHLLHDDNIRELQLITNFNYDTIDPAVFILCGQPLLMDKLRKSILNSFYQRISLKYNLGVLGKEEIKKYIQHHLKLVKCEQDILNPAAYDAVYKMSGGKGRVAGDLIKMSMRICADEKRQKITEEDIMTAAPEVL